uniref:Uncharacterized protein n=1 Tax=Lygus hesperus TaxID=30085 RepID=A0A146MD65_LYGHE
MNGIALPDRIAEVVNDVGDSEHTVKHSDLAKFHWKCLFCWRIICEGMMKKGFGGDWPAKQGGTHVPLGPHSYMTLILSIGCCAITLFLIYLIKVTPFEKLIKMMPIHKLIQILLNSKALEEEENFPRRLSQDQIASREKILATCRELEMRMTRLEQCIGPLVHSLERLTQHPDFQSASNEPVNASSETGREFLDAEGPLADSASEISCEANSLSDSGGPASSGLRMRFVPGETQN